MLLRHFAISERSRTQRALLAYLQELQQLTARRLQQEAVLKPTASVLLLNAQSSLSAYRHRRCACGPEGGSEPFAGPRPSGGVHRRNGSRFAARGIELATSKKSRNRDATRDQAETIKKERAALDTKIERTRYIPDISIQANYLTTPNISFLRRTSVRSACC